MLSFTLVGPFLGAAHSNKKPVIQTLLHNTLDSKNLNDVYQTYIRKDTWMKKWSLYLISICNCSFSIETRRQSVGGLHHSIVRGSTSKYAFENLHRIPRVRQMNAGYLNTIDNSFVVYLKHPISSQTFDSLIDTQNGLVRCVYLTLK